MMKNIGIYGDNGILNSSRYKSEKTHEFGFKLFIYIGIKGNRNGHFNWFYLQIVNVYLLIFNCIAIHLKSWFIYWFSLYLIRVLIVNLIYTFE